MPVTSSSIAAPAIPVSPTGLWRTIWCCWALSLGTAIVWGNVAGSHAAPVPTWCRMISSLLLVLAGALGYWYWRTTGAARFILLIAIGMALGTLGDFFNADLLQTIIPLPSPVLGGMASFGLGHMAYIAACFVAARAAQLRNAKLLYGWLAVWLVIATVGWYFIVYVGATDKARPLAWPALPYSLLLASTAGLASGLAAQHATFRLFALGAALFFLSDMILALGIFRGQIPFQTELVWLTYGPGQMLIVFAALAACPLLAEHASVATD